ncbi:cell wall hydrolase [Tardiphaga sp. 709]|uniref:cell wall hydrolase n=1 Tax=Tardiphaga sp. 709 TaxID=3076039 RepID=UPI0028E948A5|nr:cell wall hydrolase [Tardiphaga sp. 709]WNV09951.1 cell wall hydrolase [Tardiphaga sp. 709]
MVADSGTYDESTIMRRRKVAEAMLNDGIKPQKIEHWTQGLAQLARAGIGGYLTNQADEEKKAEDYKQTADLYRSAGLPPPTAPEATPSIFSRMASAMGGGGEPAPVTPAAPAAAPPMGTSIPQISAQPPVAPSGPGKVYTNDEPSPLDPPSGIDRKAMIATILGEAGNQGPQGMNAVGSVIRNRAVNGGFGGDTPTGVVTAKNQFEPWNTEAGRSKMSAAAADPKQAAAAEQAIAMAYGEGGQAPVDPTNGAMNFIAPKAQVALGRDMPKWAQGPGQDIGDHRFFGGKPQDPQAPYQVAGPPTAAPSGPPAIAQAMGAPPVQPTQPSGIFAGVPQDKIPGILQGLTSKNPTMKALAVQQLGQFNKTPEFGFQTQPDGTILRTDPRKGTVEPVYQGATKPTFGIIGESEDGKKTYGFIDAAKGKVTPLEQAKPGDERPTVTGPDGKEIIIPKGVDVKAFKTEVSKATADAATGKKTEVQGNAENFANRMEDAEKNFTGLEGQALGVKGAAQQILGKTPVVGSALQTSDYQKMEQAKSQFITAKLRKESGAAIGKEEFKREEKEFFPQPGDGPEVIAQKANARRVAIDAIKKTAGPGYKPPAEASKQRTTKSIGGKNYYQENGQWFEE